MNIYKTGGVVLVGIFVLIGTTLLLNQGGDGGSTGEGHLPDRAPDVEAIDGDGLVAPLSGAIEGRDVEGRSAKVEAPADEPSRKKKVARALEDQRLGLYLTGPLGGIDILSYMYNIEEGFDHGSLSSNDISARYQRLAEFYNQNKEYWDERFGVLAIERALLALNDDEADLARLERDLNPGFNYAKFWAFTTAGAIVSEEDAKSNSSGISTGLLVLSGSKTFWFRHRQGEFAVFYRWTEYIQQAKGSVLPGEKVLAKDIPLDLRNSLIDEFNSALKWQISVTPEPPRS